MDDRVIERPLAAQDTADYEPPKIVLLGDLVEVTQGNNRGGNDVGMASAP